MVIEKFLFVKFIISSVDSAKYAMSLEQPQLVLQKKQIHRLVKA